MLFVHQQDLLWLEDTCASAGRKDAYDRLNKPERRQSSYCDWLGPSPVSTSEDLASIASEGHTVVVPRMLSLLARFDGFC